MGMLGPTYIRFGYKDLRVLRFCIPVLSCSITSAALTQQGTDSFGGRNIGALIIRTRFGVYSTIIIIRNPQRASRFRFRFLRSEGFFSLGEDG